MSKLVNRIFIIRPINEEQNEFVITVGKHLATEKRFKTEKEAEQYVNEFHWDTQVAVMAEMIEMSKERENTKAIMINNGINKTKKK